MFLNDQNNSERRRKKNIEINKLRNDLNELKKELESPDLNSKNNNNR